MKTFLTLALLCATSTAVLAQDCPGADTNGTPCTSGVFVLSARGTEGDSNKPQQNAPHYTDQGGQQDVAKALISKAGGYCRSLPYAASPGLEYFASIKHGISQGQKYIKQYVDSCKGQGNPRVVLLGYSQGGQVMTSVLIGGQGIGNLDAYKQYITGGAFFASPSFVAGYEIDGGNATTSGTFARSQADYKYFNTTYSNRIRSFCQAGDEFCANAGFDSKNVDIHTAEVGTYKQAAINFLLPLV